MRRGGIYLAFGDSISWTIPTEFNAIGDDLYAYKVWRAINTEYGFIKHINRGYGGVTSQNVKDYLDSLALGINFDLVTLQVGMNDCYNNTVPVATFQTNLENIIDRLRAYRPDCEIILCKIPPTTDANRVNNRAAYNTVLNTVVANKKVLVADFSNAYDAATFCPDGIHPNVAGQKKLFDILYPVVKTTKFVTRLN